MAQHGVASARGVAFVATPTASHGIAPSVVFFTGSVALISVTVDFAIPAENQGELLVKSDARVPLESGATTHVVTGDASLPLEAPGRVAAHAIVPTETSQNLPFPLKNFGIPGFCAISGAISVGPPGGYSGVFDLVGGALVGYSIGRALRSAWIGQNLATLRRDGDNTTQAFVALSNGKFDQAGAATFLSGAGSLHLYGRTLNDQSGNAYDLNQTSPGLQPLYSGNSLGGAPILDLSLCTGATSTHFGSMQTSGTVPWSQWAGGDFTVFMVCKVPVTADASGFATGLFFGQTGYGGGTDVTVAANTFGIEVGNTAAPGNVEDFSAIGWGDGITPGWFYGPPTYSDAFAFAYNNTGTHLWSGSYNVHEMQFHKPSSFNGTYPNNIGGTSLFLYNGISTGLTYRPGTAGLVEGRYINGSGVTANYPLILGDPSAPGNGDAAAAPYADGDGQIVELMVWPSLLTAAQRSTIRQNIGAFYGISVVP